MTRTCAVCGNEFETEKPLAHRCGECKRPARSYRGTQITPREKQAIAAVCEGLCNKEIASRLHLSEGTIKVYLSKIFKKCGVETRLQLALWATKNRAPDQPPMRAEEVPEPAIGWCFF